MGIKTTFEDNDTSFEDIPLFASVEEALKDIHIEENNTTVKITVSQNKDEK